MRLERGFALLACQQANMHRKQGTPPLKLTDFMPHAEQPELTIEQAIESWG
ncbi:minor tail protein T [Synechococcus phage Yong-L1-251]|nr:minor tail protein T [Synechococcus phage Yong-L1-251]